jgi:hypothetical protein
MARLLRQEIRLVSKKLRPALVALAVNAPLSRLRLLAASTPLGALLLATASAAPAAAELDFFEKKVRPILVQRCYECHSIESGKTKGNLALDSRAATLQGGDNGAAIVVGDPEKSLVIEAIRYKNQDMKMPPKGALPAAEVKVLEQWVKMGAPDPREAVASKSLAPRGIDLEAGRKHWAFKPIQPPQTLPDGHPVDSFIRAKLAEKNLALSPPAEPLDFIRRATFDLTGLPPTPEDISQFVKESAKDRQSAIRSLIDRLLASPHYGEKWGRHWLDVARYADSNGLDENIALGTAWQYRDYVVKAFNTDKPYNRFLIEQIAGDLLPAASLEARREHATATAFLNLGAKVLAEPDKEKLVMDTVDEQIETLGRAFLGMTLGCVRCHDHKFDPISQADYYALAAIFKSTRSYSGDNIGALSTAFEIPLAGLDEFAAVKSAERALELKKKEVTAAQAALKKNKTPETMAALDRVMHEQEKIEKSLPDLPTVIGVAEAEKILPALPIHIRGNHMTLGKPISRGFPAVMQASKAPATKFPKDKSGRLELAQWLASPDHPLTSRIIVNRIWNWHFGQGIVGTTDNFGLLGDTPSHPEMLEWLAHWFTQEGWSIKDLHRLIMTSATYQQRASGTPAEADPQNRLLQFFPVRRLQAEEVRDTLLASAGLLDLHIGGKTVPLRNRQFVFNHTSKDTTSYDSTRRALYMPIIRNNLYDLFQQFDYPDPTVSTGHRNSTIVSPQALLLMNNGLVMQAADALAKSLQKKPHLEVRLNQAFLNLYGRSPEPHEIQRARDFITAADATLASEVSDANERELRAWSLYIQALFMANEFIYLR